MEFIENKGLLLRLLKKLRKLMQILNNSINKYKIWYSGLRIQISKLMLKTGISYPHLKAVPSSYLNLSTLITIIYDFGQIHERNNKIYISLHYNIYNIDSTQKNRCLKFNH